MLVWGMVSSGFLPVQSAPTLFTDHLDTRKEKAHLGGRGAVAG